MDDQIEQAMAIGQQNEHLISLGKAWCTHIRTDHSDLGVGMVEEMTGLPITGGRLTCDFAQRPGGLSAMRLEVTALGFYEDNCRGCPHRAPGGRIPNLSTWAEPLLTERDERKKAEAAAQQAALAERQRRADHRTLVAASLPASSQEIVGLINRIDLESSDTDACESIGAMARLAPDAFADDIKSMLYTDTRVLQSAVLLDVLLRVDMPGGEEIHGLCLDAVRKGWGRAEGCRYLREHGLPTDLNQDLLDSVVFHAAPEGWPMFAIRGEPAALLHYHALAPDMVEERVGTLLRHGEVRRRSAAAAASEALVGADPTCGQRLLTSLLDGLRHPEHLYDQYRSAGKIASIVAVILLDAPRVVDAAVERRWSFASSEYRSRLMGCYDAVVGGGPEQLPADVGRIVIARAVTALSELLVRHDQGVGDDYQGRAASLLEMVVRASPTDVVTPDVLIGLLLDWLDRERNLSETEPTDLLAAFEEMGTRARIGRIVRLIADAVVASGQRAPAAFIVACSDLYSGESAPFVRAEVVRMAGRVAATSYTINDALPLIYTAMLGDDPSVRAAGMEAAERVMRAIPCESIPPLLAEAVVAGLTDQYLIVVMAAITAVREVPADLIDYRDAAVKLLGAASAYAGDRLRDRMVQDALAAAHQLGRDDGHLLDPTRAAALRIVKLMPAYNARETLCWQGWLEPHDNWADVAIHALRRDDDWQYEHLGDDDKESLLERLGRRRLVAHQIDALVLGEREAGKLDWRRSLLAAELFSELGRPDLSVQMIGTHLESVPDTIEKQPVRRSIEQIMLVYRFEEAVASRQDDVRREVLNRVEELCADE